jgi:integrase/recombinase XerD
MAPRRALPAPAGDPDALAALVPRYLEWLRERAYSGETIACRRHQLAVLVAWCAERGLLWPSDLGRQAVELYQRHLAHHQKADGGSLSVRTQRGYLHTLVSFCRWLSRNRLLLYNPASDLVLPRPPHPIPRGVLTSEEVEQVMATPDLKSPSGIRDRAILETLYSTGMRRSELARLKVDDVDFDRGVVLIREGKGRKDRVVPIGERALPFVAKYLEDVRPELVVPPDEGYLFLTRFGEPLVPNRVSEVASEALKAAGLKKLGSAHLFRHTAATLMLEGGADIRFIQEMLGHECLTTTQVYTRVSIRALKQVHDATHPGARLRRRKPAGEEPAAGKASPQPLAVLLDEEKEPDEDDRLLVEEDDGEDLEP